MISLTLDTSLFIAVLDQEPGFESVLFILEQGKSGQISNHVSNRLFDHDTKNMLSERLELIRNLINHYKVSTSGSSFRAGFSTLSGGDLLSGSPCLRTKNEMQQFRKLVGQDPTNQYSGNKTIRNKLGDYDALIDHFSSKRNFFITLDKRHYFDINARSKYEARLGLLIMRPTEFVEKFTDLIQ